MLLYLTDGIYWYPTHGVLQSPQVVLVWRGSPKHPVSAEAREGWHLRASPPHSPAVLLSSLSKSSSSSVYSASTSSSSFFSSSSRASSFLKTSNSSGVE